MLEPKIDGIIFVSRNLNFLPMCLENWIITPPLRLESKHSSWLKGSTLSLSKQKLFSVKLGTLCGLNLYLVFGTQDIYIPYSEIIRCIYASFDEAILQFSNSSTSTRVLEIEGKNFEKLKPNLCVFVDEIKDFAKCLYESLCENETLSVFSIQYVANFFGQSCSLLLYKPVLQNFNISNETEIILHLAVDFSSNSEVFLWKRSRFSSIFPNKVPLEYYVGGVPGYANLVYDFKDDDVRRIKFYSSTFRYMHCHFQSLFSQPKISNELLYLTFKKWFEKKRKRNSKEIFLHRYLESLQKLSNYINNIEQINLHARCEFIINKKVLVMQNKSSYWDAVEEIFLNKIEQLHLKNLYDSFSKKNWKQLLIKNTFPFIETLKYELRNLQKQVNAKKIYMLTKEKFINAYICELMLCFVTKGYVISTQGVKRYNNELIRRLGLNKSMFQQCLCFSTIIFDNFKDKITISSSGLVQVLTENLIVLPLLNFIELSQDYTLFDFIEDLRIVGNYNIISKKVINFFKWAIYRFYRIKRISALNWRALAYLNVTDSRLDHICTALECFKLLVSSVCPCVSWIISISLDVTASIGNQKIWVWTLARNLELECFRENTFLVFPGNTIKKVIMLIPYITIQEFSIISFCSIICKYAFKRQIPISSIKVETFAHRSSFILTELERSDVIISEIFPLLVQGTVRYEDVAKLTKSVQLIFCHPF